MSLPVYLSQADAVRFRASAGGVEAAVAAYAAHRLEADEAEDPVAGSATGRAETIDAALGAGFSADEHVNFIGLKSKFVYHGLSLF
jgi:hypothetical protein